MAYPDDLQILCNNIKQLRINNRLTQREMAKLLKLGVNSLRQLERGKLPPRLSCDILFNIDKIFGIPPYQQFPPFDE